MVSTIMCIQKGLFSYYWTANSPTTVEEKNKKKILNNSCLQLIFSQDFRVKIYHLTKLDSFKQSILGLKSTHCISFCNFRLI